MSSNILPFLPALDTTRSAATTSPTRPRHQITRSISELTPPKPHRSHLHHHSSRHGKGPDQALETGNLNIHGSRHNMGTASGGITPSGSGDVSRSTSIHGARREDGRGEQMVVRKGQVREEREKGAHRAIELRNAILGLNTLSNNTTRRLDNTYYSVLEKLSVLQSTILSMKELASMARRVNDDFKTESENVVSDVSGQLDAFQGFTAQENKILSLQGRVKEGRDKVEMLGKRVDVVRERVEGWEKAEFEWQEKTRKRLRAMWLIMLICGVVFIVLVVSQYMPAGSQGPGGLKGDISALDERMPDLEDMGNGSFNLQKRVDDALGASVNWTEARLEDDPRLRLFDEL